MFRNGWFLTICFVVLIGANGLVYQTFFTPEELRVTVLPAGKGDAILIETPHGHIILVDTGPDAGILRALGSSLPMWRKDIDAIILTDVASGAAGGLPSVLDRYRSATLVRPDTQGSRTWEAAFSEAVGKQKDIRVITNATRFSTMDGVGGDVSNMPDGTLAVRIFYGATSVLIIPNTSARGMQAAAATAAAAALVISSSTPPGTYTSDGTTVTGPL